MKFPDGYRTAGARVLLLYAVLAPASMADDVDSAEAAASFLEFESVTDGRCQNLSDGGKLRILRNRHDRRDIEFRLLRTFVDKPQGLSTGRAPVGAEAVKLGCTRVDGRTQDWIVERARFASQE